MKRGTGLERQAPMLSFGGNANGGFLALVWSTFPCVSALAQWKYKFVRSRRTNAPFFEQLSIEFLSYG